MQDAVESSIHIFFDNISKSKVRKFFNKPTGNNDDKIVYMPGQITIHFRVIWSKVLKS